MVKLFQAFNFDVGHEIMLKDGISSWTYAIFEDNCCNLWLPDFYHYVRNDFNFTCIRTSYRSVGGVLKRTKQLLKNDGILIIGLPNISNADTRFKLFFGDFDYTKIGVMDKTHLRFFNQQTARELIQDSGFEIMEYFSPWQLNPTKEFIDHLPFFYRFRKLFSNNPPKFPKYSANLTDVVMLFKCQIKK